MITMAGHASAMAPETSIGASSPISSSGENLPSTPIEKKVMEITKAAIRPFVTPRGERRAGACRINDRRRQSRHCRRSIGSPSDRFRCGRLEDLLQSLNGFTVQMEDGPRAL
jgi:membrane-bound serine protease (ClpP class)